jgi:hypothetical protein
VGRPRKPELDPDRPAEYGWHRGIEPVEVGCWSLKGSVVDHPSWHLDAEVQRVEGGYIVRRIAITPAGDEPAAGGITARLLQRVSPDKIVRSLGQVSRAMRRPTQTREQIRARQREINAEWGTPFDESWEPQMADSPVITLGNIIKHFDGEQGTREARGGARKAARNPGNGVRYWAELAERYATASKIHRAPAIVLAAEGDHSVTYWRDAAKKCRAKGLLTAPAARGNARCELTALALTVLGRSK